LIAAGNLSWPHTESLFFFGVVAAMGCELAAHASRAAALAVELRASEQQIRRSAEEAKRESQAHQIEVAHLLRTASVSELSAALAHELTQPLAAILSDAQAAQLLVENDKVHLPEIRDILADIVAADNRAADVIRRLRSLLRKGDEFLPQQLNINEIVQEVCKLMGHHLSLLGVVVVTELSFDLPLVDGDRVRLQQVLINLMLNAGDAMAHASKNARTLTIRSTAVEDAVQISVADTGTGVAPGTEEKIFEPYHTTKAHGLGLGLSLSRSIVMAHGGRLWLNNDQGSGGATFHFTIAKSQLDAQSKERGSRGDLGALSEQRAG
jgi:C4-dicarboxylate-specific signal transduction histidine kinase